MKKLYPISLFLLMSMTQAFADTDATIATTTQTNCADGILQTRLQTIYTTNLVLSPFNIKTEVTGNKATLTGTLPRQAHKALAFEIAKEVGIQQIEDHITINPKTEAGENPNAYARAIADSTITTAVKLKLLTNTRLKNTDAINVTTVNGIVTLKSNMPFSAKDKKYITNLVAKTTGVNTVKNFIPTTS